MKKRIEIKELLDSEKVKKAKVMLLGNGFKDGMLFKIFIYSLLLVISYIYVKPLLEILLISFMSVLDITDPEVIYLPKQFSLIYNYRQAIFYMDYWKSLWSSLWFSLMLAFFQTIVSAMAGYSFARFEIKGKKFWFGLLLVTFIIPVPVLTAARSLMFDAFQQETAIGLTGTMYPQLLFTALGQGIYSTVLILICYNFFKQIPVALDEAAVMDGATPVQAFYHIIIKLSASVIFTVFLFSFVWNWNDLFSTIYYFPELKPLPANSEKLNGLVREGKITEAIFQAGTILTVLPLIVLYVIVQKWFVEGIEQTGMTGQ